MFSKQLKTLLEIHKRDRHGDLTEDETVIIKGALDFSHKTASQIMTPIEKVFAVDVWKNILPPFLRPSLTH
jgi:CBS domain containing-hemolysin-like protein